MGVHLKQVRRTGFDLIEYQCQHKKLALGTTEREFERWERYSSSRFLRYSNSQQ
jgi:hypothetical protein